jgi:hypothetical protein
MRLGMLVPEEPFFDRMTPTEVIAIWRAKGFTRVECRDGEESLSMDLK